jgi:dihydrofolate reductase
MKISLICGMCKNRGIGINGTLPWNFKKDMRFFKKMTIGENHEQNGILMGRKTWESLPCKPLPGRESFVISKTLAPSNLVFKDMNIAIRTAKIRGIDNLFIIGGETIYREAINNQIPDYIYLTLIHENYICDTFFPEIPKDIYPFVERHYDVENGIKLEYQLYIKDVYNSILNNFERCV